MRFFPAANHLKFQVQKQHFFVKKNKKEYPRNYRHVHLTLVPGKTMEKIILGSIEKHLEEKAVIIHRQHGFMWGKYCLLNLISFHDRVSHLIHVAKPVDVIILEFSKSFETVSHRSLLTKCPAYSRINTS